MSGTHDGLLPGTSSGDALTYAIARRVVKVHLTYLLRRFRGSTEPIRLSNGRACPSCPPVVLDQPVVFCEVWTWALNYVRRHRAELSALRAARSIDPELLALVRPTKAPTPLARESGPSPS